MDGFRQCFELKERLGKNIAFGDYRDDANGSFKKSNQETVIPLVILSSDEFKSCSG